MVSWSSRRKALTILLFTAPTILGLLIFNIYPIVMNTYISFTNRNKTHPNPNCDAGLNEYLIPNCWPAFRENLQVGLGEPFGVVDPWYRNYADLIGKLFTTEALASLGKIAMTTLPFFGVLALNRRYEKAPTRPVSSFWLWAAGIFLFAVLAWVLGLPEAVASLLNTGDFLVVVLRTFLFVILRVPLTFIIGLFLALILNSNHLKGRTFFRVILFIPWAASSMAILMALVWQFFFREQGTINQVLALLGFTPQVWLNKPASAMASIVIADIWFSYPFVMIVVLGALQSIPGETYEAAEIDGAGFWDKLMNITLPMIRPAILPAMVLTSITAFQMFGTAYAMTTGGPSAGAGRPGATELVMVYAYKQIFQTQNYGRATAFAVIIFIFLFAMTLISMRYTRITKGAYE